MTLISYTTKFEHMVLPEIILPSKLISKVFTSNDVSFANGNYTVTVTSHKSNFCCSFIPLLRISLQNYNIYMWIHAFVHRKYIPNVYFLSIVWIRSSLPEIEHPLQFFKWTFEMIWAFLSFLTEFNSSLIACIIQ